MAGAVGIPEEGLELQQEGTDLYGQGGTGQKWGLGLGREESSIVPSPKQEGRTLEQVTGQRAILVKNTGNPNTWVPKEVSMKRSEEPGRGMKPMQG